MAFDEHRALLLLSPSELEDLVKKWLSRLAKPYVWFERPTASADMGRDAVGFRTNARYDGVWDNYQCKHLKAALGTTAFCKELGKIFHYACAGEFTLPERYVFVCPNSCVRDVRKLIDRPSLIGPYLMDNWEKHCLKGIASSQTPLTEAIRSAIEGYRFENVELWKASELVELPDLRAVLHEHIDIDPGEAPLFTVKDVPREPGANEKPYVTQLVAMFGEAYGTPFANHDAVASHSTYGPQMAMQRRRFLEREAFRRHYRDNLPGAYIDQVDDGVFTAVIDRYHAMSSGPRYGRMLDLMTTAASAPVSGPLGRHHRVTASVKQGACHHFANVGQLPWS